MLNRTIPPPFRSIEEPHFPWPQPAVLKAGIPLFVLNAGSQPIIKLALVCDAGTWYEPHNGVAYFTAKMLQEGTQHRSAQAIARYIDQYGASLAVKVRPDTWSLTLVTLSKHLVPMLSLLRELLLAPTFPEERLAHLKHRKIQALKVEDEKNSLVACKQFKQVLFGSTHAYGRQLTATAIAKLTSAQLRQYYERQLLAGCRVLVSGQVEDQALQAIQKYLQPLPVQAPKPTGAIWSTQVPAQVHVPKQASLQAALNLGKVLVPKSHPDYLSLQVLNTLLGGYFGSRLMRNLREDKGYTYGVGSRLVPLKHTSYLLIATEVMQTHAQAASQEVQKELKLLQTVPVPPEELAVLRNYMLGALLAGINDPFSIMEKFKAAYLYGLDQAYYGRLYDAIMHTNAPRLMALAQQYLSTDSLSQVVVG